MAPVVAPEVNNVHTATVDVSKNKGTTEEAKPKTETCDVITTETKTETEAEVPLKIFNVKLITPGISDPLTLQISNHDTVQEIRQVVLDRSESCYRTCFSLQLENSRLDDFIELHSVEGITDGSVIKVVDEPYSVREARIHVRRLRDLLTTSFTANAFSAIDNLSPSFCSAVCGLDIEEELLKTNKDNYSSEDCSVPGCVLLEDDCSLLLEPIIPETNEPKPPQCLKELRFSYWNPPPPSRRLMGDLLYVEITTLEDVHYNITASSNGFYINKTTVETFDPKPQTESYRSQTLVAVLLQISPLFKKNFAALQRQSVKKHPLEVVPSPYQVLPWVSPRFEHGMDPFRAEDAVICRVGYEEQIPGQLRDWNEELQSAKELPKKTSHQRILRDRALYKIMCDFVAASLKGAVAVVDGNVMAINPGEDEKMRMFIWNNIFFSFACDSRDHYKNFGGDEAAYAAAGGDLTGVAVYSRLDIEGLYTLGTVIVDYRGYRVVAQSIIPGILQREQENSVVYGSIDGGKTISTHDKFKELLSKASAALHSRSHCVLNEKGNEIDLCSSFECKGIIGADGRHYILDLFRSFPPDANFVEGKKTSETEKSDEDSVKRFKYPHPHRHQLCSLRPPVVEAFVGFRYVLFVKLIAMYTSEARKAREAELATASESSKNTSDASASIAMVNGNVSNDVSVDQTVQREIQDEPIDESTSSGEAQDKNKNEIVEPTRLEETEDTSTIEDGKNQSPEGLTTEVSQPHETLEDTSQPQLNGIDSLENNEDETTTNPITIVPNGTNEDIELVSTNNMKNEINMDKCPKNELENGQSNDTLSTVTPDKVDELVNAAKGASDAFLKDEKTKEAIRQAAKAVGSLSETDFKLQFNPDIFVRQLNYAESEKEKLELDRQNVEEIGLFLSETLIPKLVDDFVSLSVVPLDGIALTEAMHLRGINMRYLGRIASLCSTREDLEHVFRISISEMISRAAKRQFKECMQSASLRTLSAATSHFLNCLLGSFSSPQPRLPTEESMRKKKSKKKGKNTVSSSNPLAWASLTPQNLWKSINEQVKAHFGYDLSCLSIDDITAKYKIQRISLLRSVCLKAGIQLLLREYDFTSVKHGPFSEEDIINLFPVQKYPEPKATDATALFEAAQGRLQTGMFAEAHDLMLEALNIFNQVYGPLHPDIVTCYRAIGRLHYLADDAAQAASYQRKAVLVSERIHGIDHPETIISYVHLALYCYAAGLVKVSLKLMYRARYLALLVYGEGHPDLGTFDVRNYCGSDPELQGTRESGRHVETNIGLMFHSLREYNLSLKFLDRALQVHKKFHGATSLQTATSYHLVARAQSAVNDYRSALASEKAAYQVYKKLFGDNDQRTKESSEYLNQMTQQAVLMQKTLNEIAGKSSGKDSANPKPSVPKVSDENYDKKILSVINRLGEAQQPGSSWVLTGF